MKLRVTERVVEAADIVSLRLADPAGATLPAAPPGAHVVLRLAEGLARQYSLCNGPGETAAFQIAVKREAASRGGSEAVHRLAPGDAVEVSAPVDRFPLDRHASHLVLLGGGIGITPLLSMAADATHRGQPCELHYFARDEENVAFREKLSEDALAWCTRLHLGLDAAGTGARLDELLKAAPAGAQVYACGPAPFIECARALTAATAGLGEFHWESFSPAEGEPQPAHDAGSADGTFTVRLARSGKVLRVEAGKSVLQVLQANGVMVDNSCMEGTCGLCATRVLAGIPEHRDEVLTDKEKEAGDMCLCVSRSRTEEIVLDL